MGDMSVLNGPWHAKHRMPANPTVEQRIAWHLEHAKNCRCRPIPAGVAELMRARGIDVPNPDAPSASSTVRDSLDPAAGPNAGPGTPS